MTEILYRNGLDPSKDVKLIHYRGAGDVAAQMLEQGSADAIMLYSPLSVIYHLQKGYVLVAKSSDYMPTYATSGLVTTSKITKEKPEVVKKMVVALSNTIQYISQNREATVQFYLEEFPTMLDRQMAEELYDTSYKTYDIRVDPEAVKVALMVEARLLGLSSYPPPEEFLDTSFVTEIEGELST